jgi:alkane 1-monooxygenase
MSVVLFGGLLIAFGVVVLPYLLIQAVYGFSLLEVVNYLEHYGLLRRKNPDGRYERCQPEHSWNSNHTVTNLFLYHLQRHSDHHANPTRKYQTLRHFDDSPQLPSGYAGMITLAYVSPLWFALMNKRVIRHYKGDLERIQFAPNKREALMKKYASFAADVKAGRA